MTILSCWRRRKGARRAGGHGRRKIGTADQAWVGIVRRLIMRYESPFSHLTVIAAGVVEVGDGDCRSGVKR